MTALVNFFDVADHWNGQAWSDPTFIYIGRANETYGFSRSVWANHILLMEDTPEARLNAIDEYRFWLNETPEGKARLKFIEMLRGKTLVCWCYPKHCHGEVLLEALGERPIVQTGQQISLTGRVATQQPTFAWETGKNPCDAMLPVGMDKYGRLYRDKTATPENVRNQHRTGIPGKHYTDWMDWYRDYLKLTLRVKGSARFSGMTDAEYAHFRYCHYLESIQGREDARSIMEREIIHELLAELETEAILEGNHT